MLLELKNLCLRLSSPIIIPRSTLGNWLALPGLDFPICLTGIAASDSPKEIKMMHALKKTRHANAVDKSQAAQRTRHKMSSPFPPARSRQS